MPLSEFSGSWKSVFLSLMCRLNILSKHRYIRKWRGLHVENCFQVMLCYGLCALHNLIRKLEDDNFFLDQFDSDGEEMETAQTWTLPEQQLLPTMMKHAIFAIKLLKQCGLNFWLIRQAIKTHNDQYIFSMFLFSHLSRASPDPITQNAFALAKFIRTSYAFDIWSPSKTSAYSLFTIAIARCVVSASKDGAEDACPCNFWNDRYSFICSAMAKPAFRGARAFRCNILLWGSSSVADALRRFKDGAALSTVVPDPELDKLGSSCCSSSSDMLDTELYVTGPRVFCRLGATGENVGSCEIFVVRSVGVAAIWGLERVTAGEGAPTSFLWEKFCESDPDAIVPSNSSCSKSKRGSVCVLNFFRFLFLYKKELVSDSSCSIGQVLTAIISSQTSSGAVGIFFSSSHPNPEFSFKIFKSL